MSEKVKGCSVLALIAVAGVVILRLVADSWAEVGMIALFVAGCLVFSWVIIALLCITSDLVEDNRPGLAVLSGAGMLLWGTLGLVRFGLPWYAFLLFVLACIVVGGLLVTMAWAIEKVKGS